MWYNPLLIASIKAHLHCHYSYRCSSKDKIRLRNQQMSIDYNARIPFQYLFQIGKMCMSPLQLLQLFLNIVQLFLPSTLQEHLQITLRNKQDWIKQLIFRPPRGPDTSTISKRKTCMSCGFSRTLDDSWCRDNQQEVWWKAIPCWRTTLKRTKGFEQITKLIL